MSAGKHSSQECLIKTFYRPVSFTSADALLNCSNPTLPTRIGTRHGQELSASPSNVLDQNIFLTTPLDFYTQVVVLKKRKT